MDPTRLVPLKFLLTAKNKQTVANHFTEVFNNRSAPITDKTKLKVAGDFNIKPEEGGQLIEATRYVISESIFNSQRNPAELFPEGFHANLRDLLCQIINANMKTWREASLSTQVSLPRLVDIDWRVDVKGASEQMAHMSVPTVLVELKVAEGADATAPPRTVNFELNAETLQAMLDGLGKIRDQLNAVKGQ